MNILDIFNIITAIVTLASVVTKITPTPKDDAILAKIMPYVKALSLAEKQIRVK